jgi:hypothetical protein
MPGIFADQFCGEVKIKEQCIPRYMCITQSIPVKELQKTTNTVPVTKIIKHKDACDNWVCEYVVVPVTVEKQTYIDTEQTKTISKCVEVFECDDCGTENGCDRPVFSGKRESIRDDCPPRHRQNNQQFNGGYYPQRRQSVDQFENQRCSPQYQRKQYKPQYGGGFF